MYYKGQGVQKNYPKAFELFQKTCDEGYEKSCYNLGVMYRNGQGVTQNLDKALALYKKACEQGLSIACDKYGKLRSEMQ